MRPKHCNKTHAFVGLCPRSMVSVLWTPWVMAWLWREWIWCFRILGPSPILPSKNTCYPQTSDTGDNWCAILRPLVANALACDCSALSPAEQWLLGGIGGSEHTAVRTSRLRQSLLRLPDSPLCWLHLTVSCCLHQSLPDRFPGAPQL